MKCNATLCCLLLFIAANLFTPAKAQVDVNDSLALVDLYNSTNGPHWSKNTNWLSTKSVSTWYGIKVTNNRVTKVYLQLNLMSGSLPASIGNLTNLQELILKENALSGTIPAEIGKLVKLKYLDLSQNGLSGAIPTSIGKLANLTNLLLPYNRLSGTIPAELGNLKKLENLYLHFNLLSGTIPASLRKLTSADIVLSNNLLSQFEQPHSALDTNDLVYCNIAHNRLTFDGLQVVAKYYPHAIYAPQDTILPIRQNGNVLSVSAGGTLSNNSYRWYQVGVDTAVIIKKDSTFTPLQSGQYYVTVWNKVANKLVLHSNTVDFTLSGTKQSSRFITKIIQPPAVMQHMQVYPNPGKDLVHVQVNGTAMIAITNGDGKLMMSKRINNSDVINVSAFTSGSYYFQNKTTGETQKVIVVH